MAPKSNPNILDTILEEVTSLKSLLKEIAIEKETKKPNTDDQFKYMPIKEIFKLKIITPATFYKYMREGKFQLFKFGGRSFVDRNEFENAFHGVKLSKAHS